MRHHICDVHALSLLDPYTARKLGRLLQEADPIAVRLRQRLEAESEQHKQRANTISNILRYTYHHPSNISEAFPLWFFRFVFAKTDHKKDKLKFVREFGPMLTFSHTIFQLVDKNDADNTLLNNYITSWKASRLEFIETMQFLDPSVPLEIDKDSLLQLKFRPDDTLSPDIKKLVRVRHQYNNIVKHKFKSLELKISIDPNRFGLPPSPERIFNLKLARLIKLQKYYRKYPPITHQDMENLDQINLLTLTGTVREAYVNFLSTEAFTIDDDARIAKSNILEKRIAISEKMKILYKEFR